MRHSNTLGAIAPALVAALAKIEGAHKDSKNPHFKNDYASLESVINASKPILTEHGITLLQFPGAAESGRIGLETVLMHESGEWITGDEAFAVPLEKPTAQAAGSALTYMRRYAQMAALNIPAVDDDGQAASAPRSEPQEAKRADPKPPTLAERSSRFVATLKGCKTQAERDKAYKLASGLLADLDAKDPERLAQINELFDDLKERVLEAAE